MRKLPVVSVPAWLSALAFITATTLPASAWTAVTAAPTEGASPDPAAVERLFALDPDRVSQREVAEVLARVPAPRIVLLQGSFAPVTMAPFA